jgi:hypothetical protein
MSFREQEITVETNKETVRRVSIRDKRLDTDSRKLLKGILHCFADEAFAEMPFMTKQQKRQGAVKLYEHGFLEITYDEQADRFGVRMCVPGEASHLRSALALTE